MLLDIARTGAGDEAAATAVAQSRLVTDDDCWEFPITVLSVSRAWASAEVSSGHTLHNVRLRQLSERV